MPQWLIRAWSGLIAGLVVLLPVVAWPHTSHAQITTDGSLGPARTLSGSSVTVGSDVGRIQGGNLFHSFGQFNVNTGQSVTFTGPTSIANILSRVTGGSPSTIDGLLRSTIPDANMFLLNPSGVLFGPNARLDVGGSFHVTTADYLRFPDGGLFQANLSRPTLLSVAPPSAFGFLSANPAPVIVQGSLLEVLPGRNISLVGGDVAVAGGVLSAAGGRVSLVSVAGPGEATFNAATQTPDLDLRSGLTGGEVSLTGARLFSDSAVRGGRILIRGGRLQAEGSQGRVTNAGLEDGDPVGIDIDVADDMVVEESSFQTGTAFARGGDIAVRAASITIGAGANLGTFSFGTGTSGSVRLSADTVSVLSAAPGILTRGLASGDAGAIAIEARLLSIDGGVVQGGIMDGRGGAITVDADRVVLAAGGGIESLGIGSGTSGSVTIRARESLIASGTGSLGAKSHINSAASGGTAGVVTVSTPMLVLDGADVGSIMSTGGGDITLKAERATLTAGTIVLSINEGARPGGNVTVTGSESIRLAGGSSVGSSAGGAGRPGRVHVSADNLSLEDASNIGSPGGASGAGDVSVRVGTLAILGGSQITAGTLGDGTGGTLTITARQSMTMAGQSSAGNQSTVNSITAGRGDAGDILVTTPVLTMTDGASIGAGTVAAGRGGDVAVNVGRLRMSGEAQIESTAIDSGVPTGPAGTVMVTASGSMSLTGQAAITALTNTAANAGTINVSTPRLTMAESAVISGTTAGAGRGGDIVVNTKELVLATGGRIDSTAQATGPGGTVTVTADTATITGRDPGTGRTSGLSSNSQASGPGGNVILRAENIVLGDGGSLQARSIGNGNAGNVTIIAGDSVRSFGGSVTTEAANGEGGNIVMTVPRLLHLVDSRVTTSVQGGSGSGGNITIDPQFVILDNSQIQANAFGGPGGNVTIVADTFLSTGSVLSASSALGAPGVVDVQAQITDVTGTLDSLPESVLQAATLLREACRVGRAEGPASSFVLGGRGGLPPAPGGPLPSPLLDEPGTAASMPAALSFSPLVLTVSCR